MPTVAVWKKPGRLGSWYVNYGWAFTGPFAHIVHGGIVKTIRGPWALQRAVRWIENAEPAELVEAE